MPTSDAPISLDGLPRLVQRDYPSCGAVNVERDSSGLDTFCRCRRDAAVTVVSARPVVLEAVIIIRI